MIALFVETLLLMAAAYLAGAALACVVRRSLFAARRPAAPAERRVDPLPDMAARSSAPARFARSAESEPTRLAPAAPAAAAAPSPAGPAQDLKRIRLIDARLEAALGKLGVTRYEQIAAWKQADVRRIADALGLEAGRISRENWIEQAQVLARGGETQYAIRRARGEAASAAPTPDEGEPRPLAGAGAQVSVAPRASTGGAAGVAVDVAVAPAARAAAPAQPPSPPAVADRAAFAVPAAAAAAAEAAPAQAVPIRPAAPAARDNLQRISGIDADIEALLASHGVTRYSQIAHWSPADVARIEKLLGSPGRIGRENWIEQAQILSRGGDTRYSLAYDRAARGEGASAPAPRPVKLADAIQENAARGGDGSRPRGDMGALRSVKAELYQGAGAAQAGEGAGGPGKVVRSAQLDDLKRIRGIGVMIEKKLNSMGVVAYEQIANWTAEDIGRVSQSLDFKGRIERENWVEQARILASGGATEFSRRVDRGEVETSRYKT